MVRLSRLILVGFLVLMMGIVIVPVEYVHMLYHHTDTKDSYTYSYPANFENSHIHCLILKTEFSQFLLTHKFQLTWFEVKQGFTVNRYQNPLLSYTFSDKEQRGPPAYLPSSRFM
jgi:hypothetical protein